MGVGIGDIIERRKIEPEYLSGRSIAIDAYNMIYQFISTIRQPDGTPLMDSHGNVTSHLSGLMYRTTDLLQAGMKPIFVFDGIPFKHKQATLERRRAHRKVAEKKWIAAKGRGDRNALRYAKASSTINAQIISDAKMLLEYMGIPCVQAPSEGEAQASHIVANGDAFCVGSQDYDTLLFGSPILVRNLTTRGKPEMILLEEELRRLGIEREQLIDMAILIGTDFNEGIKGVGPKTALKLARKYHSIEAILRNLRAEIEFEEVKNFFLHPDVTEEYDIGFKEAKIEEIKDFLCSQHDFALNRVEKALARLERVSSDQTLNQWL